jgi:hypothetical protein
MISSLSSIAQTSTTNDSGEWSVNSTWVGNAPGYTLPGNNQTNITINTGHVVHTNQGLTFSGNNGILNINGKLTINGNLTVTGNNWEVNIADGGEFIVTGNIAFNQPGQGDPASPDLTINGVATIGGNLTGTGNLLGTGELYMNGSIGDNIKVNLFDGNIVYGITDLTLPAPFGLIGSELVGPMVALEWGFMEPMPSGFIGFQVFRNNDISTPTYLATVLPGTEFLTGVTITTPNQTGYLDDDLNYGDTPKYYVRAVYYINDEIVYSGISNVVDFLNSPLPIELLSFLALPNDQSIEIRWTTATEINNDFFTIERSLDARDWEILGTLNGAGTTSQVQKYSYTDNFPHEGIAYYRLKQTDFDGSFEYFGPIAVAFGGGVSEFNMKVLKFNDHIQIILPSGNAGQLEIYDLNGRLLVSQFARGTVTLPITFGTYIVRFTNGLDTTLQKVVM